MGRIFFPSKQWDSEDELFSKSPLFILFFKNEGKKAFWIYQDNYDEFLKKYENEKNRSILYGPNVSRMEELSRKYGAVLDW